MVEPSVRPAGPTGRRQQPFSYIDVTRLPDQAVRPPRFILGDDLSSGPGEILRHSAFDAHQSLVAGAVCVCRESRSVRIEHLYLPSGAVVAILLLRAARVD